MKKQLEKLIETSRDFNTKQFASGIDISKKHQELAFKSHKNLNGRYKCGIFFSRFTKCY